MVNKLSRWGRHLFHLPWALRRRFPRRILAAIGDAVKNSEKQHRAEIRFVVEGALPFGLLIAGLSPRARAVQVFSRLRVWDTEHNNGVLIYVLLADRDVEIVADRGLNARITSAEWESICRKMEDHFRKGEFEAGSLTGIAGASDLLARHFPAGPGNPNELSDKPELI